MPSTCCRSFVQALELIWYKQERAVSEGPAGQALWWCVIGS